MNANPSHDPDSPETEHPWRQTLYILFVAQFLSMIGFAFVLPFLPFYVRELGITDERMVPVWAGVLVASGSLVMAFFSPLWGWLSDRYGRKIMVERAMFGGAVITFASNIPGATQTLPLAIYSATQTPGGEATAARLALVSFSLAMAGLLLAELIARRMHRLLGRA